MLNAEDNYPTDVARILDIKKLEYDRIANNNEDLIRLKKELEVAKEDKISSKNTIKEQQMQLQLLRRKIKH